MVSMATGSLGQEAEVSPGTTHAHLLLGDTERLFLLCSVPWDSHPHSSPANPSLLSFRKGD